MSFNIRPCTPSDVSAVLKLIKELAEFGGDLALVTVTEEDLHRCIFGSSPSAEVLVAEINHNIVGHAVFFRTNSTYTGVPGLFLEDLYVGPEYRGRGIGKSLFLEVARLAQKRNLSKVEWKAYDWNKQAIDFYLSLGATALTEQTPYKLTRAAIDKLVSAKTMTA